MRDLLPLLATARLDHATRVRVEAHVAGCEACSAELELLRTVGRAFDVPALDAARIASALPVRRRASASQPFHRQSLWRVAASLTLMIAATATVMLVRQRANQGPVMTVAVGDTGAKTAPTDTEGLRSAAPSGSASDAGLGFGVSLSDLTDAQLQTLLTSIEGFEGNVSPDPDILATPIVPSGTDLNGARN